MTKVKMGPLFRARHTSGCSGCPGYIGHGQWARADGQGRWIHARHTAAFKWRVALMCAAFGLVVLCCALGLNT